MYSSPLHLGLHFQDLLKSHFAKADVSKKLYLPTLRAFITGLAQEAKLDLIENDWKNKTTGAISAGAL